MTSSVRTPLLFVFLWSSAYIAFEFCSAHAEPATFVVVRTVTTATILLFIVLIMKLELPKRRVDIFHCCFVGILIHGIYSGGAFASIYYGIDVRLCALILSLQPLLTLLLSSTFLGEKITLRKSIGILLSLTGVIIVILESGGVSAQSELIIGSSPNTTNGILAISMCCVALLAISGATIMQKRCSGDVNPLSGNCIQFTSAAIFMLPIALVFETMQINWSVNFILGLGWLIVFVSIGAMTLLMVLIKQGDAGSVASLFYLVTPLVVLEAWIIFGDKFTPTSLVGMLLCMAGVIVVNLVSTVKPGMTRVPT